MPVKFAAHHRRLLTSTLLGLGLALFVTPGRSAGKLAESASLCRPPQAGLTAADISYVGAIRMPAGGTDTTYAYGGMTGRMVDGKVHFFVYGRGGLGDPVYEIEDPGTGYNTDYRLAPRATLVTAWGDIYHGHRTSYTPDGGPRPYLDAAHGSWTPQSLHWNESNQLLYWTYMDWYNAGYLNDWNVGATRLDNPSTAASTAYGPWRTRSTDGDGKTWFGAWRCQYLFAGPDGSMGCGATITGGVSHLPFGPDAWAGASWPTAATPAGFGVASDITLPNRYLEYYFMGNSSPTDPSYTGNYVDQSGIVHGNQRSFRRTFQQPIFEYYDSNPSRHMTLRPNPAHNGGVGGWSDMDFSTGTIWLELEHKRAVVYSAVLSGGPSQDPADCANTGHEWYRNVGQGDALCSHGCGSPLGENITGPTTTAAFPALIIYDPDDLMAVKQGTKVDYTIEPTAVIDLERTYGIATAPITYQGGAKSIAGFYFDPVRKYLFIIATAADDSRVGPVFREKLIHVFAIRDNAPGS